MAHVFVADSASQVEIKPDEIVSKTLHKEGDFQAIVFGMDTGQSYPMHSAPVIACVQVLSGCLEYDVDEEKLNLPPGSWLYMPPDTDHGFSALEPTVFVLTMVKPSGNH